MALMLKNIIFTLSSRVSIIVSAVIISVLTARFLGPTGRGEYFYIYSIAVLLANFCTIGLCTSNTYLLVKQPHLLSKLIVNSALVATIFCTLITAIIIAGIYFFIPDSPLFLWFSVILAPLNLFYLLAISLCVGAGKISMLNYYQFLTNILTILAVLIAGYYTRNINIMLLAISVAWLLIACAMFFSLYENYDDNKIKFHYDVYRMGFRYSFKAYIIGICTLVVLRTNVFLLKEMSSFSEVGYFSIAAQITDAIALLPSSIALLLFPHLLKSKTIDLVITSNILKKLGIVILALLILIWIFAPWFIKFFFGTAYVPAIKILDFMLPGTGFSCLIIILTQFLAARGFPTNLLFVWISGVVINLGLGYGLIKIYGAIGAAIGMSISYGFILLGYGFLFYLERKSDYRQLNKENTI